MSLFSMLKYNARLALKGRWGAGVLVAAMSGLFYGLMGFLQQFLLDFFSPLNGPATTIPIPAQEGPVALFQYARYSSPAELVITTLFTLFSILLLAPISLGVSGWFLDVAHGYPESPGAVFRFFRSFRLYRKAIWLEVGLTVRTLLWAVPFFAVPTSVFYASYLLLGAYQSQENRFWAVCATIGLVLSFALAIFCLFLYISLMNRYALAPYLLCRYEDLAPSRAIRASIAYTRGHRFSLLWFQLSFAGWWLLCIPLLFLPLLFLTPYLNAAKAMYARYLMELNQELGEPEPPPPADIPVAADNATREFVVLENPSQDL